MIFFGKLELTEHEHDLSIFFVLSIAFHNIIYRMNLNTASKSTYVYSDSDSNDLIPLPVFDDKKWNIGWDDIANGRLEEDTV